MNQEQQRQEGHSCFCAIVQALSVGLGLREASRPRSRECMSEDPKQGCPGMVRFINQILR